MTIEAPGKAVITTSPDNDRSAPIEQVAHLLNNANLAATSVFT